MQPLQQVLYGCHTCDMTQIALSRNMAAPGVAVPHMACQQHACLDLVGRVFGSEFGPTRPSSSAGLDSHAALAVMNHLIHLTDYGLTIVASIHQPRQEIYEAFDKVRPITLPHTPNAAQPDKPSVSLHNLHH